MEVVFDFLEKDWMLREKEVEVLNWVEIIFFYLFLRKRIIILYKIVIKSVYNWNCNCFYLFRIGFLCLSGGDFNYIYMNFKI